MFPLFTFKTLKSDKISPDSPHCDSRIWKLSQRKNDPSIFAEWTNHNQPPASVLQKFCEGHEVLPLLIPHHYSAAGGFGKSMKDSSIQKQTAFCSYQFSSLERELLQTTRGNTAIHQWLYSGQSAEIPYVLCFLYQQKWKTFHSNSNPHVWARQSPRAWGRSRTSMRKSPCHDNLSQFRYDRTPTEDDTLSEKDFCPLEDAHNEPP